MDLTQEELRVLHGGVSSIVQKGASTLPELCQEIRGVVRAHAQNASDRPAGAGVFVVVVAGPTPAAPPPAAVPAPLGFLRARLKHGEPPVCWS